MSKRGILLMIIGAAMILGALSLVLYNAGVEKFASASVEKNLPKIEQMIEKASEAQIEPSQAGEAMASLRIDNNDYIGVLKVPAVGIDLPVMSSWSYPLLKIAPCRYSGSLSGDALVIAGHNYTRHFGRLVNAVPGDKVFFTAVNGVIYEYVVVEITSLQKTQIEQMKSNDWDMTLFTCDYRGRLRIAVRCKLNEEMAY